MPDYGLCIYLGHKKVAISRYTQTQTHHKNIDCKHNMRHQQLGKTKHNIKTDFLN